MIPLKTMEQLEAEGWSEEQLTQQRWALQEGADLSNLDPTLWNVNQMDEQRIALEMGFDIGSLDPTKWDDVQMMHQRDALSRGLDLSQFDPATWDGLQMREHILAVSLGNDLLGVSPETDWAERIPKRPDGRRPKNHGLNEMGWMQLQQQRWAIEGGLDLSGTHYNRRVSSEAMRQQRFALEAGYDLTKLNLNEWRVEQLYNLRQMLMTSFDPLVMEDIGPQEWFRRQQLKDGQAHAQQDKRGVSR